MNTAVRQAVFIVLSLSDNILTIIPARGATSHKTLVVKQNQEMTCHCKLPRMHNVGLLLGHRLRRWPNIKPTLYHNVMQMTLKNDLQADKTVCNVINKNGP